MENNYEMRDSVKRIVTLMEVLVAQQCEHRDRCRVIAMPDREPDPSDLPESPGEEELITIKEAVALLNVTRFTVDAMRARGELTSISRNGRVRLNRKEVMAARSWYSVKKGKV